mgnify:CR=1 FL=1
MKYVLFIVLSMAAIVVVPFITIWSLNTLFGLGVGYTVKTWLAVTWLSTITFGGITGAINNLKK